MGWMPPPGAAACPRDRALGDYSRRWRYLRDCDPRMLVVALANKMARTVWAMTIRQEDDRNPAALQSDGRRQGKGHRSTRRDRANLHRPARRQARRPDRDAIRRAPYGPAAMDGRITRPNTRPHLTRCSEPLKKKARIKGGIRAWGGSHL